MDYSAQFRNYLLNKNASKVTVKNYASDVSHFIRWFEAELQSSFSPSLITPETIDYYRKCYSPPKADQPRADKALSAASLDRHVSSLRKFFRFLVLNGQISESPFEHAQAIEKSDPWKLKEFKDYLYVYNSSNLTIKNYINDVRQFLKWAEEVTKAKDSWIVEEQNIFPKLKPELLTEYRNRLIETRFSPRSVNRKLSSLRKYLKWAIDSGLLAQRGNSFASELNAGIDGSLRVTNLKNRRSPSERELLNLSKNPSERHLATRVAEQSASYSSFPPARLIQKTFHAAQFVLDYTLINPLAWLLLAFQQTLWRSKGRPVFIGSVRKVKSIKNLPKDFYAPLSISLTYLPLHKKVVHHLRYSRPQWYKRYHSISISHYLHWAILILIMSALGFTAYDSLREKSREGEVLAVRAESPNRILSFQGKLTDSSDTPITTTTDLRFGLYDSPTGTGSALLWQEVNTVVPDSDGVFSVLLGKVTAIPSFLFAEHAGLWLGISVGQTPEMTPRQQIATVPYASNSETLQGMRPITQSDAGTENVILALDSAGDLLIGGSATPTFVSTGEFTISGNVLVLSTLAGTDSNVEISPDGIGKIDLQKPLQNSTNNNNITTASGAVEVDDMFAILATSSGQSAFTVDQNDVGPLISASTSGTARFTVENDGDTIISGNFLSALTASRDLGSSSVRWNNLWVQTINATGTNTSGQASFTYDPLDTTIAQSTVLINPTSAAANESLLGLAVGGVERARIDLEGDAVFGFASGTLTPSDDPLNIYNHGTTRVASINTSGDLFLGDGSGSQILSVNAGNTAGTDQGYLLFEEAGSDAMSLGYLAGSSSTTRELRIASGTGITSTPLVTFEQGGNVGIGTIDPGLKLDIRGGSDITLSGRTGFLVLDAVGASLALDSDEIQAKGTDTAASILRLNDLGGNITMLANGSGSVGIGVADPILGKLNIQSADSGVSTVNGGADELVIEGSSSSGISILTPNTATATISFGDPQDNNSGNINYNHSTNTMSFRTGGLNTGLDIDSSGNVSIGGSVASAGTIRLANGASIKFRNATNTGDITALEVQLATNRTYLGDTGQETRLQGDVYVPNIGTTASAANAFINNGNINQLLRSTSSLRYKNLLGNLSLEEAQGIILNATPIVYTSKAQSDNPFTKFVGFAAEQIAEIDNRFVTFNPEGLPDWVQYQALTAPLTLVVQDLQYRLSSLESKTCVQKESEFGLVKSVCSKSTIEKLADSGAYAVKNYLGEVVTGGQILAEAVVGTLRVGYIEAQEITAGRIETDEFVSPVAEIARVETDVIAPLSSEKVVVKLEDNSASPSADSVPTLEIQNSSGSAVASIDDEGNVYTEGDISARSATFSGTLNSFGLVSETASIAGTLSAKTIVAENIESSLLTLKDQISSISGSLNTEPSNNYADIASYSASLAYVDTLQAEVGTFMQGLFAVGPTSLSDATVFGQLSVGASLTLADNSINVLGSDLELQPLKQGGVSIAGGDVYIDADGNLDVSGNATIKGTLFASVLSPVPGSDLIEVQGENGLAAASISDKGEATFNKLNLTVVEPAFALSETELIATGSAGIATISASFKEVTIQNELVTENSLIYISPVGTPSAQVPFLVRQNIRDEFTAAVSSFTVGVQEILDSPLTFNWLIIN